MLNYLKEYRTTGFDAYRFYMALKLHFNGSYDAIKYHFKTSAAKGDTYEAHKQKFFFDRAARNYTTHYTLVEFYVANLIQGNDWIGSMTEDSYLRKKAYLDSYEYNLRSEIKALEEYEKDFNTLLSSYEGLPPKIFDCVDNGLISIETIAVINNLTDFCYNAERIVSDPLKIFESKVTQVRKYQPFLREIIDHNKVRQMLISGFTQTVQ